MWTITLRFINSWIMTWTTSCSSQLFERKGPQQYLKAPTSNNNNNNLKQQPALAFQPITYTGLDKHWKLRLTLFFCIVDRRWGSLWWPCCSKWMVSCTEAVNLYVCLSLRLISHSRTVSLSLTHIHTHTHTHYAAGYQHSNGLGCVQEL